MNNIIRFFLALAHVVALSGCVVALPTESGGEEPFADERLTFIEVGRSTEKDVATAMPSPVKFLGGELWLYPRTRTEQKWLLFGVTPSAVGTDTLGGADFRFLLIRFDENGIVSSYETSSSEKRDGCNRSGVCQEGTSYAVIAPKDYEQVIKRFDISTDSCRVYVYGTQRGRIPLTLDDRSVGWLRKNVFVYAEIDPGNHELIVGNISRIGFEPTEFDCVAGSLVFLEVKTKAPGLFGGDFEVAVMRRDALDGREAIGRRQLMLHADE